MINSIIERYRSLRNRKDLQQTYEKKYAFVGIGHHSRNNLYPILDYLHVPLKYICCKSSNNLSLIEHKWQGVHATTSLSHILQDDEVEGVFVSATPAAHFDMAKQILESGKSLFIEKPPCQTAAQLQQLIGLEQKSNAATIMIGMQKRYAPAVAILANRLNKDILLTYNMKYLTGGYPEGDALTELFIHPLDLACHLFGKAQIRGCEHVRKKDKRTLLLIIEHEKATGVLELSTSYSWSDAIESLVISTVNGIYELNQMEHLTYKPLQGDIFGIPFEKMMPQKAVTQSLFARNNFVPNLLNNPIYTQGFFNEIRLFVEAVEKARRRLPYGFHSIQDTFSLIEDIRAHIVRLR